MAKFLSLEEAARSLGIPVTQLNSLREAGDVHAYRDGASWKFKEQEVQRLADVLASASDEEAASLSGLDDEIGDVDLEPDSVLLSDSELEEAAGGSSTIIGKEEAPGSGVHLSSDDDLDLGDSEVALGGSDVRLADSSNIHGASTSADVNMDSGFDDLADLPSDLDSEPSELAGGSSAKRGSSIVGVGEIDDALELSPVDESVDVEKEARSSTPSSSDKTVDLAADAGDELVLGDSSGSSGSDVTLSSEDSGIQLSEPSDSGLLLDESLDLSGSSNESLELGEESSISLDEGVDDDEEATQLKADDDFLLTPLDDTGGDETEDSGSQVIALDSDSFDEQAETMLGDHVTADDAMLADELGDTGLGPVAGPSSASFIPQQAVVPEAPYSIWNVLSLGVCVLLLTMTGMMMYDLVRNMWSWQESYALNSSLMDALTEAVPIFK